MDVQILGRNHIFNPVFRVRLGAIPAVDQGLLLQVRSGLHLLRPRGYRKVWAILPADVYTAAASALVLSSASSLLGASSSIEEELIS